jgi:hypothetical protein
MYHQRLGGARRGGEGYVAARPRFRGADGLPPTLSGRTVLVRRTCASAVKDF